MPRTVTVLLWCGASAYRALPGVGTRSYTYPVYLPSCAIYNFCHSNGCKVIYRKAEVKESRDSIVVLEELRGTCHIDEGSSMRYVGRICLNVSWCSL